MVELVLEQLMPLFQCLKHKMLNFWPNQNCDESRFKLRTLRTYKNKRFQQHNNNKIHINIYKRQNSNVIL